MGRAHDCKMRFALICYSWLQGQHVELLGLAAPRNLAQALPAYYANNVGYKTPRVERRWRNIVASKTILRCRPREPVSAQLGFDWKILLSARRV